MPSSRILRSVKSRNFIEKGVKEVIAHRKLALFAPFAYGVLTWSAWPALTPRGKFIMTAGIAGELPPSE